MENSWNRLLREAAGRLREAGVAEADLDAWYLLEHVTGMTRTDFLLHREEELPETAGDQVRQFAELVGKRAERIPLSYLTGTRMFMGLEFVVNESVLIPRQDTECLVEAALPYAAGADVLDLCTGSGCIAVSLSVLGRPKSVTGSDRSEAALALAAENGARLAPRAAGTGGKADGRPNPPQDIPSAGGVARPFSMNWIVSDLFEEVNGAFDLIVSNPPYIRSQVIDTLEPEVKEHEPRMALDGTEDGLAFYRRIAAEAPDYLNRNGRLFLEIGWDQSEAVSGLLRRRGFTEVRVRQDLAGLDRIVSGRWENGGRR